MVNPKIAKELGIAVPPDLAVARRRGDRLRAFTSAFGTERTCRPCGAMSVVRGEAENICAVRVFRLLTRKRHATADY
jgi:hypothetical protein